MSSDRPGAAYILSLIGGIFVIVGGVIIAVVRAALSFMFGGIGGLIGVLGIVWGVLILVFASRLNSDPGSHSTSGALIIFFSILSWIGALGGLFIGFLLGLIGGILAITWTPPSQQSMAQATPATVVQAGMRYCVNCGSELQPSATFCPRCGAKQP